MLAHTIINPHEYVDRCTVTVTYPGTRDVIRKTTLDGTLPSARTLPKHGYDTDGTPLVPFPIGFGHRGHHLVGFSLTHNQSPASLLSRRENEELVIAALREALPRGLWTESVEQCIDELARSGTGKEGNVASDGLARALRRANRRAARELLYVDGRNLSRFGQVIAALATNYVMFARVPDTGGRFLLKYTAQFPHSDHPSFTCVSEEAASTALSDIAMRTLFQWPQVAIDFSEATRAKSAHLELCFPDGVSPVSPGADGRWARGPALITSDGLPADMPADKPAASRISRLIRERLVENDGSEVSSTLPGQVAGPRIHFASTSDVAVPNGASVSVPVRPTRGGWLAATFFLTLLAATTSVAALLLLTADTPPTGTPLTSEHVNSIIAALVSVGSLTAARRDTHELVNRVQQSYRAALVGMSMALLLAAILGPALEDDGQTAWTVAAGVSLLFLTLQSGGWLTRRVRLAEWLLRGVTLAALSVAIHWLVGYANLLSGAVAWISALAAATALLSLIVWGYTAWHRR